MGREGILRLFVDGLIYQKQPVGGISRVFSELLPRMCDLDSSLLVTLFTDGSLAQSLPEHDRIRHRAAPAVRRSIRTRGAWRLVLDPVRRLARPVWASVRGLWMRSERDAIWHSTYYTEPKSWHGFRVVTVYDMIHERLPNLFGEPMDERARQEKRRCIQHADLVVCISESTRQDVMEICGLDPAGIHVVPPAHSAGFRPPEMSDCRVPDSIPFPFLLYVGSRSPYKNFGGLLRAYSTWAHREEVSLAVVGRPWSTSERNQLADAGVEDLVHQCSEVDDEGLCQLYGLAAALVYPSLYEGFGIPLLEAMACGCPIIASHIPSTVEVAGDLPVYFEISDGVEGIQAAFDSALTRGKDEELVEWGLEAVKGFSWDRSASQMLDLYRSLA